MPFEAIFNLIAVISTNRTTRVCWAVIHGSKVRPAGTKQKIMPSFLMGPSWEDPGKPLRLVPGATRNAWKPTGKTLAHRYRQ